MVTPQVPRGGLVGQAILGHQADGQFLNAAGVVALGPGQIGEVDGEVAVAVGAVMLGVSDEQVDGVAGAWVAQVVQGTGVGAVAAGAVATVGATAGGVVAATAFDTGLGQIRGTGDAFGDVGDVLAGTEHGGTLRKRPPLLTLRSANPIWFTRDA